jgi:hypothetical protein
MTTLQDAQAVGDRDRIKVLNVERPHVLVLVLYCDFEQVPILALQQEKEASLQRGQQSSGAVIATYLDLVQNGRDNNDTPLLSIRQWIPPLRDRHAMRRCVMMLPHDVILATHQHARRTLEFIRLRGLTSGHLDEKIGAVVCRDGFLADDVVETKVEFVEREHLRDKGVSTRSELKCVLKAFRSTAVRKSAARSRRGRGRILPPM